VSQKLFGLVRVDTRVSITLENTVATPAYRRTRRDGGGRRVHVVASPPPQ